MEKRSMFDELMEGLQSYKDHQEGKITLKTWTLKLEPTAKVTSEELTDLRERLNVSRAVFAACLRTNVRTLENWEQGRAKPNAQAALLIRLVAKHNDMLQRLQDV